MSDENKELSNAEIGSALNNIFSSLMNESKKEAASTDLYKILTENPKYFSDPKTFYYSVSYKLKKSMETALGVVKNIPEVHEAEYQDIFFNFHFYKANIERLISAFEGSSCCADKSNVIVGRYLKHLVTCDTGMWEVDDEKCYWLPRFGTQQDWYDFMHGLHYLRFGIAEKYFLSYKKLLEAGKNASNEGVQTID
jgi:hypothetical protein